MTTLTDKVRISAESTLLFTLINLPYTYELTNQWLPFSTYENGCPTMNGILIHTLVFALISFISMGNPLIETGIKLKHTIYGTLLYFLISSPILYNLTSSIFGNAPGGCPTFTSVLLHSALYFAGLLGLMYLPEQN